MPLCPCSTEFPYFPRNPTKGPRLNAGFFLQRWFVQPFPFLPIFRGKVIFLFSFLKRLFCHQRKSFVPLPPPRFSLPNTERFFLEVSRLQPISLSLHSANDKEAPTDRETKNLEKRLFLFRIPLGAIAEFPLIQTLRL